MSPKLHKIAKLIIKHHIILFLKFSIFIVNIRFSLNFVNNKKFPPLNLKQKTY